MKQDLVFIIHDIGCIIMVLAGLVGVAKLAGLMLNSSVDEPGKYFIFMSLEFLVGCFGIVELKKKHFMK
jgi:hypothetical protein